MIEYYGTYKLGNGTFFEVFIDENKKFIDIYGTEITIAELKNYEKVD